MSPQEGSAADLRAGLRASGSRLEETSLKLDSSASRKARSEGLEAGEFDGVKPSQERGAERTGPIGLCPPTGSAGSYAWSASGTDNTWKNTRTTGGGGQPHADLLRAPMAGVRRGGWTALSASVGWWLALPASGIRRSGLL